MLLTHVKKLILVCHAKKQSPVFTWVQFFFSNLSYYDWEKGEFQETTKSVDRHVTVRALDVEQAVSVCGSKVSAVLVASGRLQWQQGGGHKWSQALRPLDGILGVGTEAPPQKLGGVFKLDVDWTFQAKSFVNTPWTQVLKVPTDKVMH